MEISPRPPKSNFDFGVAVSQLFRTPGGTPWAVKLVLSTGILLGIVYAVSMAMIATPYLGFIANMDQLETNPEAALSGMGAMIPGYLLMTVGALMVLVMGEASLHRALLRGEDTPGIPLRWGMDEMRILGASLGVWLMGILAFFGLVFVAAIIGGLLTLVTPALGMILIVIAYLGGLVLWPLVVVRLAPAAALSVYNQKAHLMAGRHVSKYRFWSLFLGFLFVGFIGYIANMTVSMIGMTALIGDGSMFLASGGAVGGGQGEEIAQMIRDKFSNPLVLVGAIIYVIFYSCVVTAWLLSMAGVGSYAVKWWAEDDMGSPFD